MTEWIAGPQDDLAAAIATFTDHLPGWWYSMGECSVSCHASCGPDRTGRDGALLHDRQFDEGFHADHDQPSTMGGALLDVMEQALAHRDSDRRRVASETGTGSTEGKSAVPTGNRPYPVPGVYGPIPTTSVDANSIQHARIMGEL